MEEEIKKYENAGIDDDENQDAGEGKLSEQEKVAKLIADFTKERAHWKKKIETYSQKIRGIGTVAEAQVDLFSARQLLLEYSFKLAQIVSQLNARYRSQYGQLLKRHSENNDFKYQANEKKVLVEGELTILTEKIELIEGHRKFIDQTVQTVDHMLYGIKQRIALEEYLRAGTPK